MSASELGQVNFYNPNQLAFWYSPHGTGGGGTSTVYTLTSGGDIIYLNPGGGTVNLAETTTISQLAFNTQNISADGAGDTIIGGNLNMRNNDISGVNAIYLGDSIYFKAGGGSNNILNTSGSNLFFNGSNISAANTGSNWSLYPATNTVQLDSYGLNQTGTGQSNQLNGQTTIGTGADYFPNVTIYPYIFQVGGNVPTSVAYAINLYSGLGGTTLTAEQGISISGTVDVNINSALVALNGAVAQVNSGEFNVLSGAFTVESGTIDFNAPTGNFNIITATANTESGLITETAATSITETAPIINNITPEWTATPAVSGVGQFSIGSIAAPYTSFTVEAAGTIINSLDVAINGSAFQLNTLSNVINGGTYIQNLYSSNAATLGSLNTVNISTGTINGIPYPQNLSTNIATWSQYPATNTITASPGSNLVLQNSNGIQIATNASLAISSENDTLNLAGNILTNVANTAITMFSPYTQFSQPPYGTTSNTGVLTGVSTINGSVYPPPQITTPLASWSYIVPGSGLRLPYNNPYTWNSSPLYASYAGGLNPFAIPTFSSSNTQFNPPLNGMYRVYWNGGRAVPAVPTGTANAIANTTMAYYLKDNNTGTSYNTSILNKSYQVVADGTGSASIPEYTLNVPLTDEILLYMSTGHTYSFVTEAVFGFSSGSGNDPYTLIQGGTNTPLAQFILSYLGN